MSRFSKFETAMKLANSHREIEPNIKEIYLIKPLNESDVKEPIKLLEVVDGAFEMGIKPIAFTSSPAHDINYPSIIVEVSPAELIKIKSGSLALIKNWEIGDKLV